MPKDRNLSCFKQSLLDTRSELQLKVAEKIYKFPLSSQKYPLYNTLSIRMLL